MTETAISLAPFLSVWDDLTPEQQARLTAGSDRMSLPKNTCLHAGEEDCVGILAVETGSLRVYMLSPEGKDVTIFRIDPGEICVLSATCILSSIHFEVHIDTVGPCELIRISPKLFADVCEENIHLRCFTYEQTAERFSDMVWAMQQILFMSMDERLSVFLYDEMVKTKSATLPLTHDQIAKYMGSAREVVTRMLRYFAEEGIVELRRGEITILDTAKLKSLLPKNL